MDTMYKKNIGAWGEKIAENFLIRRGYKIINRNEKLSYGEIDLVAEKNGQTIFVEVKTRASNIFGSAADALSSFQFKTLKKSIKIYCYRRGLDLNKVRLDFISIDYKPESKTAAIKHYREII